MLKVGIIGCGRIAGGFEDENGREHPCTHAGAYSLHPKTTISAIADVVPEALVNFSKRWNVKNTYLNYNEMLQKENLDIVSVCTNENTHAQAVIDAARSGVKLIFCEKPIAKNTKEAKEMLNICKKNNVKLVINHTRRWHDNFNYVKNLLDKKELGKLVSITGRYTSGLRIMGTHMIDIMRFFVGDVISVFGEKEENKIIGNLLYSENYSDKDPSSNGFLLFENNVVGFLEGSCQKKYVLFEIDIHCTEGRVSIINNGKEIILWKNKDGSLEKIPLENLNYSPMMMNAINSLVDCINFDKESISSGLDGLKALEIIEKIEESYHQKMGGKMNKLAILGGTPIREKKFLYTAPIGEEEKNAVIKLMETKVLSGFYKDFEGGEKVKEFEKKWADYFGSKEAIAVNSGTSALHVALAAAGIGPGDEVIVTAYSFTATASSIVMNNAIPIFCDIDLNTYNIDVSKIESLITEKTKAIIPVHLFGQPAEMEKIMEIARRYNLIVIEDACQAPGTKYQGQFVGTIGHLGVFSTVETKNIVTGEGGMITTNDSDLAYKCKLIRNHGEAWMAGKPRTYLSNMLGYNFRPLELQAVIGIEQLKKLGTINKYKNELANYLLDNLKRLKGISLPKWTGDADIIHHILCLQYDEHETGVSKEKYMEALHGEGIEVTKGYPHPMYLNPIFTEKLAFGTKGCPFTCPFYGKEVNYYKGLCPVAESVCKKAIFITHIRHPNTIEDMRDIIEGFRKINDNLEQLKGEK